MAMDNYEDFEDRARTLHGLGDVKELLHWDQQVMMPEKGIKARSMQNSKIAKIYHQKITSDVLSNLFQELDLNKFDLDERANIREVRREHDRASKVPEELQEKLSKKQSTAVNRWEEAREQDDFSLVEDELKEIVELKRRYAKSIDSDKEPYRVLFEDYEPYISYERMEKILDRLKQSLTKIVDKIGDADDIDQNVFEGEFPEEKQMSISREIVGQMGYDWSRGRLDVSEHPFTLGNQFDCRITTRFDEENLAESLGATIHECGHALYELGLPQDLYGLPAGSSRDLSIHESQSRMWENHVFKSKSFLKYLLPELRDTFTDQFEGVNVEDAYRSLNRVDSDNLIRINADEITYHLHIVVRFELERALINGELEVGELPSAWNDKYEEYLGVRPDSDSEGVLQDIHWYQGSIGYFPTYSLGSVLSAQFYSKADEEIDNLEEKIASGELQSLRDWLKENIHQKGCLYRTEELVENVTGEKPTADFFLDYIERKFGDLYNIES
jgi:carboxypeptidase Taq (EC:3.4.17.19). Metallo peptidase. MEROPS family M32